MTDHEHTPEAGLLPCPLCNASAKMEELGDDDSYYVSCTGCGLQQIAKYREPEAIAAWNRRSAPTFAAGVEAAARLVEFYGQQVAVLGSGYGKLADAIRALATPSSPPAAEPSEAEVVQPVPWK
jgi:hypothetical protein